MTTASLDPVRLSRALGMPERDLGWALDEAGIDLDYLARAVRDGDPHGAIPALASRLSRPHADLFLAVAESLDLPPVEVAGLAERLGFDLALVAERIRARAGGPHAVPVHAASPRGAVPLLFRFSRHLHIAFLVLGLALVAFGGAALAWPAYVKLVLWSAFAVLLILAGAALIVAGVRAALHGPLPARPAAQAPQPRAGAAPPSAVALPAPAARRAVEDAWRAFRLGAGPERGRARRPEP